MRYLLLSLGLSLRSQLRSGRFWLALLLAAASGCLVRGALPQEGGEGAVRVGMVLPAAGGEDFREALEARGGAAVRFIRADEETARRKVASGQWDCALVLPEDFPERLARSDLEDGVTLLTGPGSAAWPLVRETAAAVLLELASPGIAEDYLRASGIGAGSPEAEALLREVLPASRRVQIEAETLDGRPMGPLALAEEGLSRIFRGSLAAALLVWTLFAAVDLGRWRQTGPARRMRPCLGGALLALPRLLAALLPALLFGGAGLLAGGQGGSSVLPLLPYLAALGALALALSSSGPLWGALPAAIPFAAASAFVLSPVFVDMTLFFPRLRPLANWLPVTLYLRGCEGDLAAMGRLLVLAAVLAAAALLPERLRREKALDK